MSVKGRTHPYRVVYQHTDQDKPGTVVIHGDRDNAENRAADIQRWGGSAQVVLVQDKVRTVVTEYHAVDTGLIDLQDVETPAYTVNELRTSGYVYRGNTTWEAYRRAVRSQRLGRAAEIRHGSVVVRTYPAVTGSALDAVREPTTDERIDRAALTSTVDEVQDITPAEVEQHERGLDAPKPAVITRRPQFCPQCGEPANVTRDPDPENDGDADCTACDWEGFASEVNDVAKPTPDYGVPTEASSPVRVEFNAEWNGGDATEVTEFDRAGWNEMTIDQRRDMLDYAASDFMSNCGASYGYSVLGDDAADVEKPPPGVPDPAVDDWARSEHRKALATGEQRRADFERILKRAAGDAADALGGKLGQALGDLLGYIAGAESFTPAGLMGEVEQLAELVTERALAHREFSRGGPDRHDIDKAARNAYSDRFEESPKLRRDHDAALTNAVDAVFDAVAWGQRKVLMNPNYGLRQVAIRARDGQYDDGYPWMVSNGGYYRDRDVEGWWEMAPTGRMFDPDNVRPDTPAPDWNRNAVYIRRDEMPPPSSIGGAAFL